MEKELRNLIVSIVGSEVYWDVTPDSGPASEPFCTLQQVGGESAWYVENAMPDHKNARVAIRVWGTRREQVGALARQIEKALCETPPANFAIRPAQAFATDYDTVLKYFGTLQYFNVNYPDP